MISTRGSGYQAHFLTKTTSFYSNRPVCISIWPYSDYLDPSWHEKKTPASKMKKPASRKPDFDQIWSLSPKHVFGIHQTWLTAKLTLTLPWWIRVAKRLVNNQWGARKRIPLEWNAKIQTLIQYWELNTFGFEFYVPKQVAVTPQGLPPPLMGAVCSQAAKSQLKYNFKTFRPPFPN